MGFYEIHWFENSATVVALVPSSAREMTVRALSFNEPVREEPVIRLAKRQAQSFGIDVAITVDSSIELPNECFVNGTLGPGIIIESNIESFQESFDQSVILIG
jgi:hypothetical protein